MAKNKKYKVVRTELGQVQIPPAPRKVKKVAEVKAPKTTKPLLPPGKCRVCGKALTRQSSILAGIGDLCRKTEDSLPKGGLAEHYAKVRVDKIPEGWIILTKALAAANKAGISNYRFIQACGGDRAIRPPLHPSFRLVYVQNTRYISKECLEHLEEARLK